MIIFYMEICNVFDFRVIKAYKTSTLIDNIHNTVP
jgi:hypothetical protein